MEIALIDRFHWSLRDLDETDIESLLSVVLTLAKRPKTSGGRPVKRAYADEVSWL